MNLVIGKQATETGTPKATSRICLPANQGSERDLKQGWNFFANDSGARSR
jgi:hypothetical protein